MPHASIASSGGYTSEARSFHSCRLVAVLFVLLASCPRCAQPREQQPRHMQRWFDNVDSDRDGQLQQQELRRFIGASLGPTDYNTKKKLDAAIEQITGKLDGDDTGFDISILEMDQYLHNVLQGVRVSDWITHSLGLPQYAQTFKDNAITVLDFPMLVNDGGKLLERELMVTRVLHRQKIIKAMQRQMLGLGAEPGSMSQFQCMTAANSSSSAAASTLDLPHSTEHSFEPVDQAKASGAGDMTAGPNHVITCTWAAPQTAGEPPLHKYVLERFSLQQPGARWEAAAELDDTLMTRFTDAVQHPGTYQYRLAAWNLYGRSPFVFSDHVEMHLVPTDAVGSWYEEHRQGMRAKHRLQQEQVPACAATSLVEQGSMQGVLQMDPNAAGVAGACADSGVVMSDNPQQQQQPDVEQQQHALRELAWSSPQQYSISPQEHQDWQQQQWQAHSTAPASACQAEDTRCSEDECHTALVLPESCRPAATDRRDVAATQLAAATAEHQHLSVIWVLDREAFSTASDLPRSSAGTVGQAQLLASMQAAAADPGSTTSSNISRLAYAQQSSGLLSLVGTCVWPWLQRMLNSLLLLVLPLLVRLLPVPVLNQLAAAVVRMIHLLPLQLQQRLLLYSPGRSQAHGATINTRRGSTSGDHLQAVVASSSMQASACSTSVQQHTAAVGADSEAVWVTAAEATQVGGHAADTSAGVHGSSRAVNANAATEVCTQVEPSYWPRTTTADLRLSDHHSASALPALQQVELTPAATRNCSTRGSMCAAAASQEEYETAGAVSAGDTRVVEQTHPGRTAGWLSAEAQDSVLVSTEECGVQVNSVQKGPGKKVCAFPGCEQHFDLRHFRALRQRHYCGRCQQAFCLQHTAYSTHGASGSCGAESRCVCVDCFQDFTPEYRMFLATRNTLNSRRTRSGPPGSSSSDGSCSTNNRQLQSSKAGLSFNLGEVRTPSAATPVGAVEKGVVTAESDPGYLDGKKGLGMARRNWTHKSSPDLQVHQRQQHVASSGRSVRFGSHRRCSHPGVDLQRGNDSSSDGFMIDQLLDTGAVGSSGSVLGKKLWARGLAKARAVVRFKQAGQEHRQ